MSFLSAKITRPFEIAFDSDRKAGQLHFPCSVQPLQPLLGWLIAFVLPWESLNAETSGGFNYLTSRLSDQVPPLWTPTCFLRLMALFTSASVCEFLPCFMHLSLCQISFHFLLPSMRTLYCRNWLVILRGISSERPLLRGLMESLLQYRYLDPPGRRLRWTVPRDPAPSGYQELPLWKRSLCSQTYLVSAAFLICEFVLFSWSAAVILGAVLTAASVRRFAAFSSIYILFMLLLGVG